MKDVADNFTNVYFRIFLLLLGFPLVAQAGDVDFSNYDVPLYTQIVDTIKAKIAPRLGEGTLTRERYFIIPFAYQDRENHPEFSHSFITVIRVFADNKQPNLTRGLAMRKYKNREFEAFTISWLPRDFLTNPHLCVFDGPGARLFPKQNKCPISPGRNFTLAETIKLAVDAKNAVAMWGPYEIRKEAFNRAVARKRLLDQGKIKYRVVGIAWGGTSPVNPLIIRFNPEEDYAPVDNFTQTKNDPWTLWTHAWSPRGPGTYSIRLAVKDPSVPTRRLDSGYYVRSVEISEV